MIKHTVLKNKIFPLKCRKFQFKSYHGKHRNMLIKTVNCHISCYDFIVKHKLTLSIFLSSSVLFHNMKT